MHFHDILLTDVVDVMPHPGTSAESVKLVRTFAERLHQTVIVLERENVGYVFNAMLSDLFKSALALAANGVAAVKDIDRAWMGVLQAPMGPFGMMDSVDLDTVWKINDYWANNKYGRSQRIAVGLVSMFTDLEVALIHLARMLGQYRIDARIRLVISEIFPVGMPLDALRIAERFCATRFPSRQNLGQHGSH